MADGSAQPYTTFARPEDIATIWVEAWMRRDADTLASLFDEDAEFVNVTGLWWHSREAIRKAHAYGLSVIFQESTLTLRRVTVKHLRDEVAVVHARMHLTGQTPFSDIAEPQPRATVFSFVVHQTDEGWRCASAQNTEVVPGMETHLAGADGSLQAVDYRKRNS